MGRLLYSPVFYFAGGVSALASSPQVPSRADLQQTAEVCHAAPSPRQENEKKQDIIIVCWM